MPIALEIVSPDRLLLSQPVDMVVMPAAEGEMGVLPCTVLADEAVPTTELSRAQAQARLQEAEAAYAAADRMDVAALDAAMARTQAARAMVAAAEAP